MDTLVAAEEVRARSIAAGFAPLTGDPAPAITRNVAAFRQLRRLTPAQRPRSLARLSPAARGRLLAGFSAAQRRAVLKGLRTSLVVKLNREWRAAAKGRPQDFAGGTRGLDIVLDATGVTQLVSTLQPGLAPCRFAVSGGRRRFVSASAVILTPESTAPRATLAHELFHGVQCNANNSGSAGLLSEGAAEWHAALVEPAAFTGAVIDDPGGAQRVVGGAARSISFCNDFDPVRLAGLDAYESWPVWMALELASPGTIRGIMTGAPTSLPTTPQAVLARVGADRWSAALAVAVREVCGNLRSPSAATLFPSAIQDYFGALRPPASPGVSTPLVVPAGGAASVGAIWPPGSTTVTLRVAPASLADRLVARSGGVLLTVGSDGAAAVVAVPAELLLAQRSASLTLANPLTTTPTTATIDVVAG